jgi:hypothetical protein
LYLALIGDLIQLHDGQIRVGSFTPEQEALLRREHPFLYLHVFYRVPNQFIVATMDELRDSLQNTALIAAAEKLLNRLITHEGDLDFVKRSYELTALSGTLCQHRPFAARYHGRRSSLLEAKEDGLRAVQYGRPADKSRDMNYWMQAVLTDWVLFPNQVQDDPTAADAEYDRMVQYLRGHLPPVLDDYYDLMIAYLAGAVEAALRETRWIRDLLDTHGVGPQRLTALFQREDYNEERFGSYALCLAAGYVTLFCPSIGWSVDSLALPIAKAQRFFFDRQDRHGGQTGVILGVVALKYAACCLFYLYLRKDFTGLAAEAGTFLTRLRELAPHLAPHAILRGFFFDLK